MDSIKEEVTSEGALKFIDHAMRNWDLDGFSGDDLEDFRKALNDFRLQSTSDLRAKAEGLAEALAMIAGHKRDTAYKFKDDYYACRSIARQALTKWDQSQ